MKRGLLLSLGLLSGCGSRTELTLAIRLPADRRLLSAVTQVQLSAARDGVVLSEASFASTASQVSVSGVSHGPRTIVTLDGIDAAGDVIARGRSCPIDFEAAGMSAPLYFAPTNFFAPTATAPATPRVGPVALTLGDATVLLIGGAQAGSSGDGGSAAVFGSGELFVPGAATFAPAAATLSIPRWRAAAVRLASAGVLVTGGLDASGRTVAQAELYAEAEKQVLPISDPRLDGRVDHRVVVLPDGRAFLSGGSNSDGGAPLASSVFLSVRADGTYQVAAGPPLAEARRAHAATIAIGVPVVFGGYGSDGKPLSSIEALDPAASTANAAPVIARLAQARAEATASSLGDGSILLVGGVGATGAPLASAEVFNPVTRSTTVYAMAAHRRGHTATVLADGRVLVAGGFDENGAQLASVELFAIDLGFVTERSLTTARGGHAAVPLCDGTVLLVGGGPGAELYSGPAD